LHHALDQLGRNRLLATPRGEHHLLIPHGRVAHRLCDRTLLLEEDRYIGQLPGGQLASGQEVERELKLPQRAGIAGDLHLARGQLVPGVRIP